MGTTMICGIVDLGSNTIRLSIYKYEDGVTKLLLSKKSIAGLLGYVTDGVLSKKGVNKACSVLLNFQDILSNFNIENAYVFATASLRNITNTREVIDKIRSETGYEIELLSGEDEATLDFYGAVRATELTSGLLVDIGGGSTELVRFDDMTVESAVSIPVGSLNLSLRHAPDIIPSNTSIKLIRQDVLTELAKLDPSKATGAPVVCGVGGTVRAARKIYNDLYDLPNSNMTMDADKLQKLLSVYKKNTKQIMRRVMQLAPDRIHTAITGIVVLTTISKVYGVREIIVSTRGVREGYLYQKVLGGEIA